MKGYSASEPEQFINHNGGLQFRYNIEEVTSEVDGNQITQWQYDFVNVQDKNSAAVVAEMAKQETAQSDDLDTIVRGVAKKQRDDSVNKLTVTTTTEKVFDADETSQNRMVRALMVAELSDQDQTEWVMADNTVQTVSLAEMREALALALQAQSDVWFI